MTGKRAQQLHRVVDTRWLSLGDALDIIVVQWDVLQAYFVAEANGHGSDLYTCRQLSVMYNPRNKVVITFVSEQIGHLNQLNKAFQGEQPDQSRLLDHLMAYYYSVLDQIITADGLRRAKASTDPLSFDILPYQKEPSAIHFG